MTSDDEDTPAEPGLEGINEPNAGLGATGRLARISTDAERRVAMLQRSGRPAGTGFLVGPDLLLTAAHVFASPTLPPPIDRVTAVFDFVEGESASPAETGVRVRVAEFLDGSLPAPCETNPFAKDQGVIPPDRLDFALLRLARPVPDFVDERGLAVPRGYYRLEPDTYAFSSAGLLFVFQHPLGELQRESTIRGRVEPVAEGRRVRYQANTWKGSSGSPVIDDWGRLVAVHHFSSGGHNQGVPISAIATALLAGAYGDELRRLAAQPVRSSRRAGRNPVAEGAVAMGASLGSLLGPLGTGTTGPEAEGRRSTAREVVEHHVPADSRRSLGSGLVAEAVRTMEVRAGDGAVTAAVLAAALIEEAERRCAAGASPFELRREAAHAVAVARAKLARLSRPCEDVRAVTASATADRALAEAVAGAALRAGPTGVLLCEPGDGMGVDVVTTQGLRMPAGYESPHAVTDDWRGEARLVRPYILLLGYVQEDGSRLRRLLRKVEAEGRPVLIVTTEPDVALLSALRGLRDGPVPPVVRIAEGSGRRARLRDLATLTGGKVIASDLQRYAETASLGDLGNADLVTVSATETVVVGGQGGSSPIELRVRSTRNDRVTADPADRADLDERLSWLTATVVRLRVGAGSTAELPGRVHAAGRAARSAQAALRSGTVPGGGLAFLLCREPPTDPASGAAVVHTALAAPFRLLARSAGLRTVEADRLIEDGPVGLDVFSGAVADPPHRDATETVDLAVVTAMTALERFVAHALG
jgi:chaperonin GroEL